MKEDYKQIPDDIWRKLARAALAPIYLYYNIDAKGLDNTVGKKRLTTRVRAYGMNLHHLDSNEERYIVMYEKKFCEYKRLKPNTRHCEYFSIMS